MAWTTPIDQVTGHLVTATEWNAQVIDNLKYLHGDSGLIGLNNGIFTIQASGSTSIENFLTGTDTQPSYRIFGSGSIALGPGGSTATDTSVGRTAAGLFVMSQGNGIGYATGAGGAVSQTTSRSTAVTLNKATGQITVNTTASASGTTYNFVVNNSLVAATDVVVLCGGSNWPTAWGDVRCTGVGSGLFGVQYTAQSIDTTALLINFAILKGANS